MPQVIKLKSSVVKDKTPNAADIQIGEVCVGANSDSPMLLFKDNADNIIKIQPGSGVTPGPNPPDSPTEGDLWYDENTSSLKYWNGLTWVELAASTGSSVDSVNGQSGVVVLDAEDVGALAPGDDISELNNDSGFITLAEVPASPVTSVNTKIGDVVLTASDVGAATDVQGGKADTALQPGDDISELNNNENFIDAAGAPVQSVNGKAGTVVLDVGDINDVTLSTVNNGDILTWATDKWVNSAAPPADISGSSIGDLNDVDTTGVSDGQYLYWNAAGGQWLPTAAPGGAVDSVNGETGTVVLTASDVGAATAAQGLLADSAIQPGVVNPVYFANQAAFPDAASPDVHGGVAHSHADGAMFFAHGGVWNQLANQLSLADFVPTGSWSSIPALT